MGGKTTGFAIPGQGRPASLVTSFVMLVGTTSDPFWKLLDCKLHEGETVSTIFTYLHETTVTPLSSSADRMPVLFSGLPLSRLPFNTLNNYIKYVLVSEEGMLSI